MSPATREDDAMASKQNATAPDGRACQAEDCGGDVYARGRSSRHDKQVLRRGEVKPDRAHRTCRTTVRHFGWEMQR